MDNTPQAQAATRGMTPRRWVVLALGGYVLSTVFYLLGFFAWVMLRLPTLWTAQGPSNPLLFGVSITLSTLAMGKLLHVRGPRQWALAFALIVTALYVVEVVLPSVVQFGQGV